jgi:putative SOS response-associated peptidase YedK
MRWGIVPAWKHGSAPLLINARSETAATKPMFRKALQSRRCLIPANGFYEWVRRDAVAVIV